MRHFHQPPGPLPQCRAHRQIHTGPPCVTPHLLTLACGSWSCHQTTRRSLSWGQGLHGMLLCWLLAGGIHLSRWGSQAEGHSFTGRVPVCSCGVCKLRNGSPCALLCLIDSRSGVIHCIQLICAQCNASPHQRWCNQAILLITVGHAVDSARVTALHHTI